MVNACQDVDLISVLIPLSDEAAVLRHWQVAYDSRIPSNQLLL
jgi:hypothetical protein